MYYDYNSYIDWTTQVFFNWKVIKMKNRLRSVIYAFLVLFFLSGCATYRIRLGTTREWIEGKPFPVEITFTETDKIADVVLRYSFNGTSTKTVTMNQAGNYFTHTIPGEEVVPGVLRYDIVYKFKGQAKSTGSISVKIFSLAEARQKFTRELSSRIAFSPPSQVPVNRDTQLIVKVKSHKPSTKVTFFYKTPAQSSFQETELRNVNGTFTAVISERDLQDGYDTYYFIVTEDNADVGELTVFINGHDSTNPFQFTILSLAELKQVIKRELYKSVSHEAPHDVYETRDLEIGLSVRYDPDSYIHEFSKNSVSVEIMYKSPASRFKRGSMSSRENQFSYTISSADLKSGYNAYRFKITDDIEDIGPVTVEYPASGDLFSYRILTVEEIRERLQNSLYTRTSHAPVTETDGLYDLILNLRVENAKSITTAVLFFKKPAMKRYKSINMTRKGNVFTGAISADEQQSGHTQYYFVVTEEDSDVGTVSAEFPENGRKSPIQYSVLDKNIVKARLEADLKARISHRPVTSASEGEDLELTITVADVKSGTEVYFYHRKPGESSYRRTRLPGNGPRYTMVMPKQDIRAGYSQYYFEVKQPHGYFGFIVATSATPSSPYEFVIRKLKDAIVDGIGFTPILDAEQGVPVEVKITLNNNPSGTRVYLKYRLSGEALEYLSVEMERDGKEYAAVLSPAQLKESTRIDYYFSIIVDRDELTYPDESIIPLYFHVRKRPVEGGVYDTVFGTTVRSKTKMLEGKIFELKPGMKNLPQNMQKDHEPSIVVYTTQLDISPRELKKGSPGLGDIFKWFGVQYRGVLSIREAGPYRFRLLSDDGSKLYIDDVLVIDNDGVHDVKSETGEVFLSAGTHTIRVDYFQGPKKMIALQLFVTPPGGEEKLFDLDDFE